MSKVAKQCILLLVVLVIALAIYAGFVSMQKQQVEQVRGTLEKEIEDYRAREKAQLAEAKKIKDQIDAMEAEKAKLEEELKKFSDIDVDGLNDQIAQLTQERDELQKRAEALAQDREALVMKLDKKPEPQVVYKYVDAQGNEVDPAKLAEEAPAQSGLSVDVGGGLTESDEIYWAQVLKEKKVLELEVEKLRSDLSRASVQVTELKKKNSDMQLELAKVMNEKEEIERQIKYGKDLSDSLSLELARAQNDKKFLNDRLLKINEDNLGLQDQIKELTSTKIALEKSIVRLQDEKKDTEKKLMETENVIQGRIDEIWEIKKSLDDSFGPDAKNTSEVELPPIVVSSQNMEGDQDPNAIDVPGINGSVVSVNSDNNFVIIDIGQDKGIRLGDNLNVYRGVEYVAGLEVIQVRKDIAAADIISKVTDIKIGDVVR